MSDSGPKRIVSDDEILAVFRTSDDPVLTAGEVAERVPITRRSVHDRLTTLQEQGMLERKNIGPRTIWWLAKTAEEDTAPATPLQNLVGLVDEETATQARKRSQEWREEFNQEIRTGKPQ